MAKTEAQKVKALFVAKYLLENSDENHPCTAEDIADALLDDYGITAERRSIHRDIAALRDVFGMDIETVKGGKIRLLSRQFEFDDLRLLAECVDAAKFISASKAKDLVSMLGELCSTHQAEQLESETFVCNRAKTTQKGVLTTITKIRSAMAKQKDGQPHTPHKITFKYLEYTIDDVHNQKERGQGRLYKVSPYKLLMNDGNYYLLAYNEQKQDIWTYRIDRMKDVKETNEPREGKQAFEAIDMETYTQRVFSMFSGEKQRISIRFINKHLNTAVERFGTGKDVFYRPDDGRHFVVNTEVEISAQFYGWLCGFGTEAVIISPPAAVAAYKAHLEKVLTKY